MRDKILIILGVLITIMITGIIILVVNQDREEQENIQKLDLTNNNLSNTIIDNGLLLQNSKVECDNEICVITITATNNTASDIDMTSYRISFLNIDDDEVYWYSGQSISNVPANSEINFSLEIPRDLKDVKKIVYTKSL